MILFTESLCLVFLSHIYLVQNYWLFGLFPAMYISWEYRIKETFSLLAVMSYADQHIGLCESKSILWQSRHAIMDAEIRVMKIETWAGSEILLQQNHHVLLIFSIREIREYLRLFSRFLESCNCIIVPVTEEIQSTGLKPSGGQIISSFLYVLHLSHLG